MGRVIIEKADGSQASVVESEFKKHYPDEAYTVLGDETDASFEPVGIPKQRAPRRAPKPKAVKKAAPKATTPAPVASASEPS